MWFTRNKDYDRFWIRSILQLAAFGLLCMVLFATAIIVVVSDNFFYQTRLHTFDNYIDISRLIRVEDFFLQVESGASSDASKKEIFERVLGESQIELSPYLYNGEIFKIDSLQRRAETTLSLNPVEVGHYVSDDWLQEAFRSISLQTYVWHVVSPYYFVVGMPVLSDVDRVDLNVHMALSWIVPNYNFSLDWVGLVVVFILLVLLSSAIFIFIFIPHIKNVYEPDMRVIERGQDRFDAAWRRLRKAQVFLLQLEDD
ncbi:MULTISPECIES: hypothetical protein [Candidatus Ichthyocystis]|uniref:Putative membrane protein n=1 Tax=Candidatus Ichthyocystis hellenicum TaxID=1561003 RepID=A0A0S4LZX1_9BURK|nr:MULTISPECIES: hypothetical protein [Ichthyocystis]CUT17095.1 putative membrane protein [Candidatus Ichthyocystis hellenicum]